MTSAKKFLSLIPALLALFLLLRWAVPLLLPFLIGAGLALAAEPLTSFFCRRLRMRRPLAAGISVSLAFSLLVLGVLLLCSLVLRQLRALAGILPEMELTLRGGLDSLSRWMLGLAAQAPGTVGTVLTRNVQEFFSDGSALLGQVTDRLLGLASALLGRMPDGFLSLGTAVISSFMISAKLPKFREYLAARHLPEKLAPVLKTLSRLKAALWGWLRAQLRLSGVSFLLLALGLLLLGVRHAVLWALVIALVDALPILGSGAALIPWSLVSFLQGNRFLAFGLLALYGAAALTRSVLEPRLVGKQLGLDPLVTLMALYLGYKLWGLPGMLLAPALAVAALQLLEPEPGTG